MAKTTTVDKTLTKTVYHRYRCPTRGLVHRISYYLGKRFRKP